MQENWLYLGRVDLQNASATASKGGLMIRVWANQRIFRRFDVMTECLRTIRDDVTSQGAAGAQTMYPVTTPMPIELRF